MSTSPLKTGATLAAVTGICIVLVVLLARVTEQPVADAQRRAALDQISEILPPDLYDNDPLTDVLTVSAPDGLGGVAQDVFRAYRDGQPAALVMQAQTLSGYAGRIDLLIAVEASGQVLGVRVTYHRETPGLGDPIDVRISNWIRSFDGRSLADPLPERWGVKRDGGDFDQFTAATITPRAVVEAVRNALEYYANHQSMLFAQTANSTGEQQQ